MEHALSLARRGIGTTSPNPRVGAVVVLNGEIIAEGWHKKPGNPHAEIIALNDAGSRAKGADLYVTLEPCSTTGRTPPCTDAIIKAGIRNVIIGALDLNPEHSGRALGILQDADVNTTSGILEGQCRKLNEGFEKYITQHVPFVTVKAGMSLDGRIATRTGDSKWITSDKSRELAHLMRNRTDAIMIGIGTAGKDDPSLTVRCECHEVHHPRKVVVDELAEINIESRLLSPDIAPLTIVAVTKTAPEEKISQIKSTGAEVLKCNDFNGLVDTKDLMRKLADMGIVYILVEGGGMLIADLLRNRLADKIAFFYAPIIIGGRDAVSVVMGEGVDAIDKAVRVRDITLTNIEKDILVEGYIEK